MIALLIWLIILGVILYAVETILPIDPGIKLVIRVAVIIVALLYVLQVLTGDIPLPHLRR